MKGVILGFDAATLRGDIRAEDGTRYAFTTAEWRTAGVPPRAGMSVDFEPSGTNATGIYAAAGASPGPSFGGGAGGGDVAQLFMARPAITGSILMILGCLFPILSVGMGPMSIGANLFQMMGGPGGGATQIVVYLFLAVPALAAYVLFLEFTKRPEGAPANLRMISGAAGAGGTVLLWVLAMTQLGQAAAYGASVSPSIGAFVIIAGGVISLLNGLGTLKSFGGAQQ